MLFILLINTLSHQTPLYHRCIHDTIQKQIKVQSVSIETTQTRTKTRSKQTLGSSREPIRIHLDYRINNDELQCVSAGQQISWQGSQFTCDSRDIFNQEQKSALIGTMNNVRDYLQGILLVDRVNGPIPIFPKVDNYFTLNNAPEHVSDTDIFLSVFIRTYGDSSTLAAAHYISVDPKSYRPLQGAIYVNSRYLPNTIQNENTTDTKFFYTVVHEIFHALGISSESFLHYHPKGTNEPYDNPLVTLNDEKTGKNHTFLVTPYSHKFAVMQWGVEKFTINGHSVKSGIEIEDGGGQGTAASHPECRIANQDLMVGVSLQTEKGPYNRFTPLTAAILLDTGNYDIVWSRIQPLIWGNKDAIDGKYIENFVTGPPANVFPQQYIYRPNEDPYFDACGFTFKMIGGLNMFSISENDVFNCSLKNWQNYAETKAYCEAEKFYNPKGNDVIGGNWPFDFQIVHFPSEEICEVGYACIAGVSKCVPYSIADDEKSFNITVDGLVHVCNESNENKLEYNIDGHKIQYGVKCPPVQQFVRTVKMMENLKYLKENPLGDNGSNENNKGLPKGAVIGIVVAVIVVVIVVVVVVVILVIKKRKGADVVSDKSP